MGTQASESQNVFDGMRVCSHTHVAGAPLMSLALMVVGCASPSLMPQGQALAIKDRERALASHAEAIQAAISQSGKVGALAFLDAKDSHLVVLPGEQSGRCLGALHHVA